MLCISFIGDLKGSTELNPTKSINEIAEKTPQKHFEGNCYSALAKPKQTQQECVIMTLRVSLPKGQTISTITNGSN
jgi:hypothetical protein